MLNLQPSLLNYVMCNVVLKCSSRVWQGAEGSELGPVEGPGAVAITGSCSCQKNVLTYLESEEGVLPRSA